MPSTALAIASSRVAIRGFRSRHASARSRAGLAKSVGITSAAPIGPPALMGLTGNHASQFPGFTGEPVLPLGGI